MDLHGIPLSIYLFQGPLLCQSSDRCFALRLTLLCYLIKVRLVWWVRQQWLGSNTGVKQWGSRILLCPILWCMIIMWRILTPPGSAQVSQKTFFMLHLATIYKACLFLLWFLGYGYSRHQTVAPHIADLSICTFWRSSRVTTWFQWTELASMLLCQVNVQFLAFCALPGTPS